MKLGRRIGRNTLAKVAGEVASRAGGLLFYFLLARMLGPAAFGQYSFAFSYALLFAVLVDLGTNVIFTREIARRPHELAHWVPRINGLKLVSAAVFLLVLAASLPLAPTARDLAGLILPLGVLVAGTLVFESFCAVLSGLERMELEALAKAAHKAALLAGTVAGYAVTRTLGGAIGGLLAGLAFSLVLVYLLLMRLGAPAAVRWDGAWNRTLLGQSLPLIVSWVFWNLYDNQDVVVLTFMGTAAAVVGHFAAAMKLMDALRGLPVLITGAVFPMLSHAAATDSAAFARVAVLLLRGSLALAIPLAIGVAALAPQMVRAVFGPGFEPAADALRVAAWALIGIFLNHAFIHLLVARDLQRRTIAGAAGAAVANLAALLLLAPRFGLAGAGASLVIGEITFLAINARAIRALGLHLARPLAVQALQALAAAAAGSGLAWALLSRGPWVAAPAGLAGYALVLAGLSGRFRWARGRP